MYSFQYKEKYDDDDDDYHNESILYIPSSQFCVIKPVFLSISFEEQL